MQTDFESSYGISGGASSQQLQPLHVSSDSSAARSTHQQQLSQLPQLHSAPENMSAAAAALVATASPYPAHRDAAATDDSLVTSSYPAVALSTFKGATTAASSHSGSAPVFRASVPQPGDRHDSFSDDFAPMPSYTFDPFTTPPNASSAAAAAAANYANNTADDVKAKPEADDVLRQSPPSSSNQSQTSRTESANLIILDSEDPNRFGFAPNSDTVSALPADDVIVGSSATSGVEPDALSDYDNQPAIVDFDPQYESEADTLKVLTSSEELSSQSARGSTTQQQQQPQQPPQQQQQHVTSGDSSDTSDSSAEEEQRIFERLTKKRTSIQSLHSNNSQGLGGESYLAGNIDIFQTPETNWLLGNNSTSAERDVTTIESFNPYATDPSAGYFGNFGRPPAAVVGNSAPPPPPPYVRTRGDLAPATRNDHKLLLKDPADETKV